MKMKGLSGLYADCLPLISWVDEFGALQRPDGGVGQGHTRAALLLRSIVAGLGSLAERLDQGEFLAALHDDVEVWIRRGLDTPPQFDLARDAYRPPTNHAATFLCLPFEATNGTTPGTRLELLLAVRYEPAELLATAERYPLSQTQRQSMCLVAASRGLRIGNCIALFPEGVAGAQRGMRQHFGMFFLNKFQAIYETQTLPAAWRETDGPGRGRENGWQSVNMSPAACYSARCLWAYLHDYFHHQGPRPLHENPTVKRNWFVGVLEETKVDAQAGQVSQLPGTPFGPEQIEFMLLERIFRYTKHPDAVRNFDAGSGLFMYSWLRAAGAIGLGSDGRLQLDWPACVVSLGDLADAITTVERTARDDDDYRAKARALVRTHLPAGADGDRFRLTDDHRRVARSELDEKPIEFTFRSF
jgi:Family of unknown function (DUF6421)